MRWVNTDKANYRHSRGQIQVITLWTNNIRSGVYYRKVLEENIIKQRSKEEKQKRGNKNYIRQNISFVTHTTTTTKTTKNTINNNNNNNNNSSFYVLTQNRRANKEANTSHERKQIKKGIKRKTDQINLYSLHANVNGGDNDIDNNNNNNTVHRLLMCRFVASTDYRSIIALG
jgi:hypothetical protein